MEVQKPQTVQITFNNKTITLHNVTIVDADPNRIIINRQFAPVNTTSVITNNTQNIPGNTSKISRHKSPTSSPIAKKKFIGTPNQSDLDLSFQCMFCDDIHEELDHLVSHMRNQHPDLINLPDEETVDNIDDINKTTHSTTNSIGEDDFDEYIEEEEEEEQFVIKDDETENTIDYDETSCSSSRPPSSPPSPEYEEHISFSRLQEIQREMEMQREQELKNRKNLKDTVSFNNSKSINIEAETISFKKKSDSSDECVENSNLLNSNENDNTKNRISFDNHATPSITLSKSSDKMNEVIIPNLKNLPGIPEESEEDFQRKSSFMDSFHDYEASVKYSDAKMCSPDEIRNIIRQQTNYSPEHHLLTDNQQETEISLKNREIQLIKLANQEQYFSNCENLRQEEAYSTEAKVYSEENNHKSEYNDQYEDKADEENGTEHFEYPDQYSGYAEENYPDSGENSDSDHSMSFDCFDQELLNMLEPICELKSEDDEKVNLNQEAMELYRMAMELNYLENGIKKRGKRKNLPTIDENSSESMNEKTIIANNNIQPNVIKLPQGPGRGRRREIDEAEMELINSGPNCFFQCNLCDKSYKYAGDLAKHVRSHTLNRPYQCSICDKSFTHIGSLNTHLRIHSGERPYKCNFTNCDKSFTQSNSLMVHMKSHLSNKPYQCDICNKGFLNASSLAMHQKTHTDSEPITCPECFKEFKHANLLSEHMQIHKQSMLYQCSLCRKQFEQACLLVQHMKEHTGDKPFRCEICHKSFTQPGSLNTHLRIHTGEKPFKCQHCEKSFTQASSLSVHVKVHLGEKQYKCKYCLKDYSQHSYLQKHIQQMHLSRNEVPKINDEVYAAKSSVSQTNQQYQSQQSQQKSQNNHMKQNFQNPTDFDCPLCGLKCANTSDLILHLRIHCDLN